MSKPQSKIYSRTVFVVEGIKTAVVVSNVAGRMRKTERPFRSPEAALTWCRKHRANLVYSPADDPSQN